MQIPLEDRKKYIERRISDLTACKKALEAKDYVFLMRIGHQIKGNAATFSFDDLAPVATALETAAEAKNDFEIHEVLAKLEDAILNIKI